jgi:hypothetical protein
MSGNLFYDQFAPFQAATRAAHALRLMASVTDLQKGAVTDRFAKVAGA